MSKLLYQVDGPKIGRELFAQNMGYSYENSDLTLVGRSVEEIFAAIKTMGYEIKRSAKASLKDVDIVDENIIEVDHYGHIQNETGSCFNRTAAGLKILSKKVNETNSKTASLILLDPFLLDQYLHYGVVNSQYFFLNLTGLRNPGFSWRDSKLIKPIGLWSVSHQFYDSLIGYRQEDNYPMVGKIKDKKYSIN